MVTGGPVDPLPRAFPRGSQMRVGNGNGAGLENAAEHSPALRLYAWRARATVRPAQGAAALAGAMFWLPRNTLSGSHAALIAASRS